MEDNKKLSKIAKIFVEPDEEIVFTVEKILKADGARSVLVIPHNAALITSSVSLKILARQIAKSEKLIVLVSDTDVGVKLAQKANLVAKKRISEVDKMAWEKAKELKESQVLEKARTKKELLNARGNETSSIGSIPDNSELSESTADSLEKEREDTIKGMEKDVSLKHIVTDAKVKAKIEEDSVAVAPVIIPEKKRLPEKIVEIGGIKVFSGGDIAENVELLMSERDKNLDEDDIEEMEKRVEELNAAKSQKNNEKSEADRGFVGKDLTSVTSSFKSSRMSAGKKNLPQNFKKKAAGVGNFLGNIFEKITEGKRLSRGIMIIFGLIIFCMAVAYFFFASVNITLTFAENTVKINKTINASIATTAVDSTGLQIPAAQLSKNSSISEETTATGKGTKGEVAKGVVRIYNKTGKPLTLKAGTLLTNINTTLKYKLVNDVTLGIDENKDNQAIVAETFGENYNITIKSVLTFSVGSYDTTSQVVAYGFYDVTGGTSQNTVVVSQEDIDTIKASLQDKLKQQLLDNLTTLISDEDILLTGSEKFTVDEFTTSIPLNGETDKFTADLKMSVTALKITKSDLQTVAENIAKQESGGDLLSAIKVSDPVVDNIKIADDGKSATFNIRSNAGVVADVDIDSIKAQLKGKNLDEAKDILSKIPGINEFKIRYNPPFIPFFLQKIPDDLAKITITKEAITAAPAN